MTKGSKSTTSRASERMSPAQYDMINIKLNQIIDVVNQLLARPAFSSNDITALRSGYESVKESVDKLNTDVAGLGASLSEDADHVVNQLKAFTVVSGDYTAELSVLNSNARAIYENQEKLAELTGSTANITSVLTEVVSTIRQYVVDLRSEVIKYMESAGVLNDTMKNADDLIDVLQKSVNSIDVKIAGINENIASLETYSDRINKLALSLLSSIKFQGKVSQVTECVEDITSSIANIHGVVGRRGGNL